MNSLLKPHRHDTTMYLTFLFVFPFAPHWLIRAGSPHLGKIVALLSISF